MPASGFSILCVTNRSLCPGDFLARIEELAACRPSALLLREKDLAEGEYEELAKKVMALCKAHEVSCILHSFHRVAHRLHAKALHLPLPMLRTLPAKNRSAFPVLGSSCHSIEEAAEAEKLGCTYITAGHVFDTDCKRGIPGRGIPFLQQVCRAVSIPVYAIGGIGPENIRRVQQAGAKGACIMSGAMVCKDAGKYLDALREVEINI